MADTKVITPDELPAGLPRLATGMKLVTEEPFLGVCIMDQLEQGEYGYQVHIAVKPVDRELKGRAGTGAYHSYYTISAAARSKCGHLMEAANKAFGSGMEIGAGKLVGIPAIWVRRDIKFGKDRDTGEQMVASGVLLPLRRANEEEAARAEGLDLTVGRAEQVGDVTPGAPDWTDDEIRAVAQVVNGRTPKDIQVAAGRSKIAGSLKQAIINGSALDMLRERGILSEQDGKYVVAEEWAA